MKRRWVTTRFGHRLHLVPPEAAWPWGEEVVTRQVLTACGHSWLAVIPGVLTRIAGPRCKAYCRSAGVPEGTGAWLGPQRVGDRFTEAEIAAMIGGNT